MYTINTETYAQVLDKCYKTKAPLFVYGPPGVGKSEIPRQVFPKTAKSMNRTYLDWVESTHDEKMAAIESPEKYWVFCDQRVGQMDSTDLRGIPNMINSDMLETIPMAWIIYFTSAKAAGAIFFDELNLAAPVVAGQAYQIINERAVSDRTLAKDVFVFGAGNRAGIDQAYVQEMPFPLKDRFCEVELQPSANLWIKNYAAKNVNPHLVAFIGWKASYLFKVDESKTNKSSTPRGIKRASDLMDGMDILSNEAHMYVSMSVGEAFATEFQAYTKHYADLDWDELLSNPSVIGEYKIDRVWAVVGGIVERMKCIEAKASPQNQALFDSYMDLVYPHMATDFAVSTLRMVRDQAGPQWKKFIKKYNKTAELSQKYSKLLF